MVRLIIFLIAIAALGFAFAWVADRPGEVTLVWQGMRYQTSLMVAVSAFAALVAAIMTVWWAIMTVLRSPALMRRFFRNRRRDRGYHALSQGLIAAGSGDAANARKLAGQSRKLLGGEALVELLDAQTSLLEGDHDKARTRFEKMLEDNDTRLVALRGLYLEAEREGAREAARHYAEEAANAAPALSWAGSAKLKFQSAEADWSGAIETLQTMRNADVLDKAEAERKRAVLLTAEAMAAVQAEPEKAARLAREAHKLAEDLVPAATIAAAALTRTNDLRRAARILEATWKKSPHPDIAEAYVHLRTGDSVRDRLKRARKLAGMVPDDPEGNLAIAEAAITANEWKAAREAMQPVLSDRPTQRACLIMADIEEGEHGDRGRMRDWLARAVRAPRDPVWIADGLVSERWLPVSPATGRLDAFEWKSPPGLLGAPSQDFSELEVNEFDSPDSDDMPEERAADMRADMPVEADEAETITATIKDVPPAESDAEPESATVTEDKASAEKDEAVQKVTAAAETKAEDIAATSTSESVEDKVRQGGEQEDEPEKKAEVFAFDRPPDDPGVDPEAAEEEEKEKAFRLF